MQSTVFQESHFNLRMSLVVVFYVFVLAELLYDRFVFDLKGIWSSEQMLGTFGIYRLPIHQSCAKIRTDDGSTIP